jgi:hypothetical protein
VTRGAGKTGRRQRSALFEGGRQHGAVGLIRYQQHEAGTFPRTAGAGGCRLDMPHGRHGHPDRGKGAPMGEPRATVPPV